MQLETELLVKIIPSPLIEARTFAGENSIVIVLGANESLTPEHVDSAVDVIESANVLLCQFEVPLEATLRALKLHRGHGSFYPRAFLSRFIRCIRVYVFLSRSRAIASPRKDEVKSGNRRDKIYETCYPTSVSGLLFRKDCPDLR